MDIWDKFKSKSGYHMNDDGTDSYGVDHSGFSLRDELKYQIDRVNNEQQQSMTSGQTPTPWSPQAAQASARTTSRFEKIQTPWSTGNETTPSVASSTVPTPPTTTSGQDVFSQQASRRAENDLLMNGMDVLYGINRTVNGMTFGGLDWLGNQLGYDTQMNNYLQLKDPQSRELAQTAGQIAGYGGSALTGGAIAQAGYNQANMAYNGYKIGQAYDKLSDNPYQGNGSDIIARMKNHNGEPVVLQRGEAILGENGQPIVYGKALGRATGSSRNYGLNKIIYKHDMPRNEVTHIPRYLKNNQPIEISQRGQGVYAIRQPNGEIRLVTTPKEGENIVSSMYYLSR